MPNICIVGFGSIGKQYYNVILEHFKDFRIYIISRRNIKIENAIVLNELKQLPNNIDYVIISNPAPFHLESAFYFLDKNIPVLIMTDAIDQFWLPMIGSFKDKKFTSITQGQINLDDLDEKNKDKKSKNKDQKEKQDKE